MPKFIPREKLGKKTRRALDAERRATWGFSPVTRKVENKRHYQRKQRTPVRYEDAGGDFLRLYNKSWGKEQKSGQSKPNQVKWKCKDPQPEEGILCPRKIIAQNS